MINRKSLIVLTLLSLILVLSIYYFVVPEDMLKEDKKTSSISAVLEEVDVKDNDLLVGLRLDLDSKREVEVSNLQKELTLDNISLEEKNNAIDNIKYISNLKTKEESIEKVIKEKLNIDCFVETDKKYIKTICVSKDDIELANNIMNLIKDNIDTKIPVTVEFHN